MRRILFPIALALLALTPAYAETPPAGPPVEKTPSEPTIQEEIALIASSADALLESADILLAPEMVAARKNSARRAEISAAVREFFAQTRVHVYATQDLVGRLAKLGPSAENRALIRQMSELTPRTRTLQEKVEQVKTAYGQPS